MSPAVAVPKSNGWMYENAWKTSERRCDPTVGDSCRADDAAALPKAFHDAAMLPEAFLNAGKFPDEYREAAMRPDASLNAAASEVEGI